MSLFEDEESNATSWLDVSISPDFGKSVPPTLAIENRRNTSVTFYIQKKDNPNICQVSYNNNNNFKKFPEITFIDR